MAVENYFSIENIEKKPSLHTKNEVEVKKEKRRKEHWLNIDNIEHNKCVVKYGVILRFLRKYLKYM